MKPFSRAVFGVYVFGFVFDERMIGATSADVSESLSYSRNDAAPLEGK